jgi:hypothetical protein
VARTWKTRTARRVLRCSPTDPVANTGLARGKVGIETAVKAIAAKASSTTSNADTAANAVADQLQDLTLNICKDTTAIKVAQNQLATRLVAFKPYASIVSASDAADCANDVKN